MPAPGCTPATETAPAVHACAAGSGSIFETLRLRRPLIVVPNPLLMDNHQAELAAKLESMGHLAAATPDTLAAVIARLDESTLVPYEPGSPSGIVRQIDALVGRAGAAPQLDVAKAQ